ncbi:MAG: cell division protein SepF [Ruminococcus sp.]|nr:cell division protein SepF [Ruminococcus sp.]
MKLFENIKEFFFSDEEDINDQADMPSPRHERSYNAAPDYEEQQTAETGRRNKVVNIQTTAQLQVVLVKPSAFTDAKQIADHLIAKKTVVLNLETASPDNKRRIIDFLVGVAYANGGSLKPVANLTYIITPYNVGFIGEDLVGELENNGVFI